MELEDLEINLLENLHVGLPDPTDNGVSTVVKGTYRYYHYDCDKFVDKGWGCGYRTLQTLCSWVRSCSDDSAKVPSIYEIQKTLVDIEDKPATFTGSRDWIGSVEVCLVIDQLYDVPCKIMHVKCGQLYDHTEELVRHFRDKGSPIMMGGDKDCSSKCIVGVHISIDDQYLLVIDPHFYGATKTIELLQKELWVRWQNVSEFFDSSFYNFCLPQLKYKDIN